MTEIEALVIGASCRRRRCDVLEDNKPTYDEVVEALVALVYEDCTENARLQLFATLPAEIQAIKVLERLNRVHNVREVNGNLRADWGKVNED